MPECGTPLWPCAMTGAAACLAGFEGIHVVIHGSSGCYYYPSTLIGAPLYGTFILENEVVFGSGDRLKEVIGDLSGKGGRIAVITTCVPSVMGEDISAILPENDIILVDSPGFAGELETGYRAALAALSPKVDPKRKGVNIDGVSLSDPFHKGNIAEVTRLLRMAGIPVGTVFCRDWAEMAAHAAPFTIGTNADFASGVGNSLGGTLGIPALRATFEQLERELPEADASRVFEELDLAEGRVIGVCDRFLRRHTPPSVAIFAGAAYADYAAETLKAYLDAEIRFVGTRNEPPAGKKTGYRREKANDLGVVAERIREAAPDLVIGSAFEQPVCPGAAFVGLIPPLQDRVRLTYPPLAGTEGTLRFVEEILNTCMDRVKRRSVPER
ncbi:nitrogenase component 1 [Methanoregula sp. UBA64]|uniref:nitrogenase component 1 n=1 Tax=Methanoregula sp. UBA64 TaxID=1915554 RepID=UPI0025DA51CA|nr:nitrogenase component 1 [Methanoregula sp. UBA64]